jgi:DNA-directed RNA polymerase subunit RPC12/RpoP
MPATTCSACGASVEFTRDEEKDEFAQWGHVECPRPDCSANLLIRGKVVKEEVPEREEPPGDSEDQTP